MFFMANDQTQRWSGTNNRASFASSDDESIIPVCNTSLRARIRALTELVRLANLKRLGAKSPRQQDISLRHSVTAM